MNTFDMHFHSQLSDGKSTTEEILDRAKELWLDMLTLTDHDRISTDDFRLWANERGMKSYASTEISTRNYDEWKSLHLTCYAQSFWDELYKILNNTISWKEEMLSTQIDVFIEKWFMIEKQAFYDYHKSNWKNSDTLNKFNVAQFMYEEKFNKMKVTEIMWQEVGVEEFYLAFLKEWGEFYEEYHKQIPDYEPSVESIWKLAQQDSAILSIAHPNFSFSRDHISGFKEKLPYYLDRWVNAIEINSKASKKWIEAIYHLKNKYNLLLTLWSDNHGIWSTDRKHEDFGKTNELLSIENKEQIWRKIVEYLDY